jgi:spermidine synthase
MPRGDAPTGVRLAPLLLLFLLSGASALVYQVLWMRLLALVFGVTVHAASTVLAAFMGGLALGSAAAGRLADRVRRPLLAFAVAEALVAVAALATPFGLGAVEAIYVRLHGSLAAWPAVVTVVRLLLSFAVLIVPTTLMGATLPLVVKSALARRGILERDVSLLYAFNTAGAVAGTLTAGIWLVPQLGIAWAFRVGALANLIAAAGALLLERVAPAVAVTSDDAQEARAAPPQAGAAAPLPAAVQRVILVTFAISGFVSFGLEIIWFRMLVILFRPTTYAFTMMLATVLAGIALGSLLAAPLSRVRRLQPLTALAALEVLLALAAAASMAIIGNANAIFVWAGPFFAGGPLAYFGPMAVTSIAAILPSALLMGMAFPIGIGLWTASVSPAHAGRRIGLIYAVNVAGAVAGSLVTGFVLLPLFGGRTSLLIASGLALAAGVLLLASLRRPIAAVAVSIAAIAAFAGIARRTSDPAVQLLRSRYPREVSVWRKEDSHAMVSILRRDSAFAAPVHALYINGMHQASDTPSMVGYHRLIGTLPMAVHAAPRRALVIGAGGGATAGAVAAFSAATAVDVVELSPAVVEATRQFSGINQNLLERPNVTVRVDDGRNYMLLTPKRYDVITADVILPVHAGAGNLYSVEYYRLMRRVLDHRGIALQWIGSVSDTEYKLIMRTFVSVFPHTTLWHGGSLMIGATRPLVLDEEAFLAKQADPQSAAALDAMGFTTFDALLASYTAGPAELKAFVGDGPVLTDDRPLTEYFLALPQDDPPVDLSRLQGEVWRHVVRARPPAAGGAAGRGAAVATAASRSGS